MEAAQLACMQFQQVLSMLQAAGMQPLPTLHCAPLHAGHGGPHAANFAKEHLLPNLLSNLSSSTSDAKAAISACGLCAETPALLAAQKLAACSRARFGAGLRLTAARCWHSKHLPPNTHSHTCVHTAAEAFERTDADYIQQLTGTSRDDGCVSGGGKLFCLPALQPLAACKAASVQLPHLASGITSADAAPAPATLQSPPGAPPSPRC